MCRSLQRRWDAALDTTSRALAGVVIVGLLIYLTYALLRPERF